MNTITPTPKQQEALDMNVDLLLFGGATMSGKGYTLILEALKHKRSLIISHSYPSSQDLTQKALLFGGEYNKSNHSMTIGNSRILFLSNDKNDAVKYALAALDYEFIGIRGIEEFSYFDFMRILDNARRAKIMASFSSLGLHEAELNKSDGTWVKDLWSAWLIKNSNYAAPGEIRWLSMPEKEKPVVMKTKIENVSMRSVSCVFYNIFDLKVQSFDAKSFISYIEGSFSERQAELLLDGTKSIYDPNKATAIGFVRTKSF